MSDERRQQRPIDSVWDADTQNDEPDRWDTNSDFGDVPGVSAHGAPVGHGKRATTRGNGSRYRRISRKLLVTLALLSVILGFCCTQSTLSLVDALAAGRDAQAQVTTLEGMLKGGDYFDTDHLNELQTHLLTLNGDLDRLHHDVPWGASHVPVGSSIVHL